MLDDERPNKGIPADSADVAEKRSMRRLWFCADDVSADAIAGETWLVCTRPEDADSVT